jgi:signal transduction histidine kinase
MQEALTALRVQEREMSARAEASERLSDEIVDSLTSGLLVVSGEGDVRILNPAGQRMLKLSPGVIARPYREALTGIAPLAEVVGECLKSGKPVVRMQFSLESALHDVRHMGVSLSPLSGAEGLPRGVICLFADLTPVIEMEEQLRLKESLAQVGEITAGIAHEFRNGLATIHGYARLLDLNALPESFRPYVEAIRQETTMLGEVVTNFLNFARPAPVSLLPVDLLPIAERAAEEVRNEARAHGGDVLLRGTFGTVQGDDVLLRQAISNLLRNAVEACVGASITPQVVIEGCVEAAHVRVTVEDNGPGIPSASRERIFRPFFTTKGRGTGLGLALVQKIIVTHNGRITVGAAAAGGARLQVVLPILPEKDEPEHSRSICSA